MIKKQNLLFFMLVSIVFVLSIYYISMPNELLKDIDTNENEVIKEESVVKEIDTLVAMRVSLEEERQVSIDKLQELLVSDSLGGEEKNNIYNQLKYLNEVQSIEEELEKKKKKKYNINCFVKIDNSNCDLYCISKEHNNSLANNIMRLIQSEFKEQMFITVKFGK